MKLINQILNYKYYSNKLKDKILNMKIKLLIMKIKFLKCKFYQINKIEKCNLLH